MKKLIAISSFFYLTILTVFGQTNFAFQNQTSRISMPTFYLYYGEAGLGSNMGDFLPTIRINDGILLYTLEQNSYWLVKENHIDTICIKQVRQSSIDSILYLIQDFKDTTIYEFNYCMMSGGVYNMTISNGPNTLRFSLMNTFDYTALKIVTILNTYFPTDKKLKVDEQMIKDAQDCWTEMLKRWAENDKKKKRRPKNKNGT